MEGRVAGALWDLSDTHPYYNPDTFTYWDGNDYYNGNFTADVWNIFRNQNVNDDTFLKFWEDWLTAHPVGETRHIARGAVFQNTISYYHNTNPLIQVTLQGDGRPYHPGFYVPLTLKLYNTSPEITTANILQYWNQPLYQYTTDADTITIVSINEANKTVTFSVAWDCPNGTYQVLLYSPQNLVNKRNYVVINPSQSPFSMDTLLEGDAQDISEGSVVIDIIDFSILYTAYGSRPGDPNWDERADFDRNLIVDIVDFTLFQANYEKTSPQTVGGGQAAGGSVYGEANLSIETTEKTASTGSTFYASIQVDASNQAVAGVAAYLNFDPVCLEVVGIVPGKTLGLEMLNRFDNVEGTIDLAFGRDFGLEPASDTFTLATIEFKAKKAGETSITFEHNPPRKTDAAIDGYSVLGKAADLSIDILP